MKDFKGRECSSRHFKRGDHLVPVMIPIDWKKEWRDLKKRCMQLGEEDIPEAEYWKWREEKEKRPPHKSIFHRTFKFLQTLKEQL